MVFIQSTQFGCVGFIYDNNYERLCDNDNFGKLIYPEPDGAIRITIFSGFPPERDNPKAKAGPKFQQDYELRDYDEVWVTADNCLAHTGWFFRLKLELNLVGKRSCTG